jgi:hypothetical protein
LEKDTAPPATEGAAPNLNNRSQSVSLIDVKMFKGGWFRVSAVILRGRSMPTDLGMALERKRKATQAHTQTEITTALVWFIVCLVMLVLLFADQSLSKTTIGWECLLAP